MRGTYRMGMAALALAAASAALPTLAFAGGSNSGNPQEQARIEEWIAQAIQGNGEAERQEQARIERLVQQALDRAAWRDGRAVDGGPGGRVSVFTAGRAGAMGR